MCLCAQVSRSPRSSRNDLRDPTYTVTEVCIASNCDPPNSLWVASAVQISYAIYRTVYAYVNGRKNSFQFCWLSTIYDRSRDTNFLPYLSNSPFPCKWIESVVSFFTPKYVQIDVKNLLTDFWPLSEKTTIRVPYRSTQSYRKLYTTYVDMISETGVDLVRLSYLSVMATPNWFPVSVPVDSRST